VGLHGAQAIPDGAGPALEAGRDLEAGLRDRQVRSIPATSLITPAEWEPPNLGPAGRLLAEVLARHVTITDIHDELSFYEQLAHLISQAQSSLS
jgi:hypothetical protein